MRVLSSNKVMLGALVCVSFFLMAEASRACSCYCDALCVDLGDCCSNCRAGDMPTSVKVDQIAGNEVLITVTGPLTMT